MLGGEAPATEPHEHRVGHTERGLWASARARLMGAATAECLEVSMLRRNKALGLMPLGCDASFRSECLLAGF